MCVGRWLKCIFPCAFPTISTHIALRNSIYSRNFPAATFFFKKKKKTVISEYKFVNSTVFRVIQRTGAIAKLHIECHQRSIIARVILRMLCPGSTFPKVNPAEIGASYGYVWSRRDRPLSNSCDLQFTHTNTIIHVHVYVSIFAKQNINVSFCIPSTKWTFFMLRSFSFLSFCPLICWKLGRYLFPYISRNNSQIFIRFSRLRRHENSSLNPWLYDIFDNYIGATMITTFLSCSEQNFIFVLIQCAELKESLFGNGRKNSMVNVASLKKWNFFKKRRYFVVHVELNIFG